MHAQPQPARRTAEAEILVARREFKRERYVQRTELTAELSRWDQAPAPSFSPCIKFPIKNGLQDSSSFLMCLLSYASQPRWGVFGHSYLGDHLPLLVTSTWSSTWGLRGLFFTFHCPHQTRNAADNVQENTCSRGAWVSIQVTFPGTWDWAPCSAWSPLKIFSLSLCPCPSLSLSLSNKDKENKF